MHICFLTHEYPKPGFPHGGIGSFIKTFATQLVKNGHKVSIIGIGYSEIDEIYSEDGVSIFRLGPVKLKGLSWFLNSGKINRKISELHKENPINIIESTETGLAFIKRLNGIKYIIRLHGGHHFFAEAENRGINKWKGFQEKRSFKKADAFIGVSNFVIKHTSQYLSFQGKPVITIYNSVNFELFKPQQHKYNSENNLVFAGTVSDKKGIRQLLAAMPIITNSFPKVELHIFGRDSKINGNESYINTIKKQFPTDTFNNIIFEGPVNLNDMPSVYQIAEICIFPSHMETMGLVAAEAMAMEKPVIFTTSGPGPEVIKDGITGLLCNPLNPADIAEKVIYLLTYKDKAIELSRNARIDVLERFNSNNLLEKNIDFYRSIIG